LDEKIDVEREQEAKTRVEKELYQDDQRLDSLCQEERPPLQAISDEDEGRIGKKDTRKTGERKEKETIKIGNERNQAEDGGRKIQIS